MTSNQTPSCVVTSVCPPEFNGPPSAFPTVEGLPTACSVATLPRTTVEEPPITSSTSLVLDHKEGEPGYPLPDDKDFQNSGSRDSYKTWLTGVGVVIAYGAVLTGHSAFFKNPNREIRDAKEREEEEERPAAKDALSLGVTRKEDGQREVIEH